MIVVVSGSEPEEDAPTATVVSTQAISDVTEESPTVIESDTASQNTPVPPASDVIAETTPIWPLLIGIGLVGAAVVTFIVVRAHGAAHKILFRRFPLLLTADRQAFICRFSYPHSYKMRNLIIG